MEGCIFRYSFHRLRALLLALNLGRQLHFPQLLAIFFSQQHDEHASRDYCRCTLSTHSQYLNPLRGHLQALQQSEIYPPLSAPRRTLTLELSLRKFHSDTRKLDWRCDILHDNDPADTVPLLASFHLLQGNLGASLPVSLAGQVDQVWAQKMLALTGAFVLLTALASGVTKLLPDPKTLRWSFCARTASLQSKQE